MTAGAGAALVLVATPIGNLGDLSPRAIEELRGATVIAAEDTRRARVLCSAVGIAAGNRLRAVHGHNERSEAHRVVDAIRGGARVVYVSDAGMPGISDPGEQLVRACVEAGCPVEVVPGPSALLTALVLSGLPTSRFHFEGFLPRKGAGRAERLACDRDLGGDDGLLRVTASGGSDARGPARGVRTAPICQPWRVS